MSKAFTREDDDAGFTLDPARARPRIATPVTALGARLARERAEAIAVRLETERAAGSDPGAEELRALQAERERMGALASARIAAPPEDAGVAAFGARVRLRSTTGRERVAFIASADEVGLVPHAATATSPFASALLGARAGEVVEIDGPRGPEEFVVVDVTFPT